MLHRYYKYIPYEYATNTLYKILEQRRIFERFIYAITEPQHGLNRVYSRVIFIKTRVHAYEIENFEDDSANG